MKNKSKDNLSEEHLRKLKHNFNYIVSETPKYRKLVDETDEFDLLPQTNEVEEEEEVEAEIDVEKEMGTPPEEEIGAAPVPAFDQAGEESEEIPPVEEIEPDAGDQVDEIQNEIIKHNISAMKSIHGELESLGNVVKNLNTKLEDLNGEVEEVREPTNTEKLMTQKNVSYPYYFNLNDFWSNNWFDQKKEEKEVEKGINELPDGSYVADFDDIDNGSNFDITNSFDA